MQPGLFRKKPTNIHSGEADSVLVGMWRQIKVDFHLDDSKVEDLIQRYADTVKHENPKQRSPLRGNLRGDLGGDSMTWYAFLKAMKVLRATKMHVTLRLQHLRLCSNHTLVVNLDEMEHAKPDVKEGGRNQLSTFFLEIQSELGINPNKFEELIRSYMIRARIPMTAVNRSQTRGNLKKELLGPNLSWKSFIKGLCFLCVTQFDMIVDLELRGKEHSLHIRTIVLNELEDFESERDSIAKGALL